MNPVSSSNINHFSVNYYDAKTLSELKLKVNEKFNQACLGYFR